MHILEPQNHVNELGAHKINLETYEMPPVTHPSHRLETVRKIKVEVVIALIVKTPFQSY